MKKKYFITGATGLVGGAVAKYLSTQGQEVVALVRDETKAQEIFADYPSVTLLEGGLDQEIIYDGSVDYIIHAAAPTNSVFFIKKPVETIDSIVAGTKTILEFARSKRVSSMINLSSMEVYGITTDGEALTEDKQFYLDPRNIRSNYPIAKRLAENMCVAYEAEYEVPVKTVRLAQVIGKELLPGDNRLIAMCVNAVVDSRDIELSTDGATKQTYIAIEDAISGILTVLQEGVNGDVYNLANDDTYMSVRDLAELVARDLSGGDISVKINVDKRHIGKYPPARTLRLNTDKLRALGWAPVTDLRMALDTLISSAGSRK